VKVKTYLPAFQSVEADSELRLIGDFLLVEVIKDEEFSKQIKTDDGRVVSLSLNPDANKKQVFGLSADKPTFIRILTVGPGFYDDENPEKTQSLESQPGQICLIASGSVKPFSVFGKLTSYGEVQLGLARESDIQARFESEEAFDRYFERLNRAVEGKVQS
jgi:hypothetical protein